MSQQKRIRRLLAGGGILALAFAGLMGTTTVASATEPDPKPTTGTLTIHKHVQDNESTPGHPAGAALPGVGFSVQEIGAGTPCAALDLMTPTGWADVAAAIDKFDPATGAVPAGFCELGDTRDVETGADGTVSIIGLTGLYLVKETRPGPHLISQAAEPFLVTVPMPDDKGDFNYDVHAYPKNKLDDFTPTKTVGGANVDGKVVPGAIVPWTIEAAVPAAVFPYHAIEITDTPATGHAFDAWGKVWLGTTELGAGDYTTSGNTITFTAAGLAKVNAVTTAGQVAVIEAELTTKVVADPPLGALKNKGSVKLNGQTKPTDEPQSNWGELVIKKHKAGDTNATLEGARFAVYEKKSASCSTDVTGTPVWETPAEAGATQSAVLWISNTHPGAAVGSKAYCLLETKAPAGYVLDTIPREIVISAANEWVTTYHFPNVKPEGPDLPLTGGAGSMSFGIVGLGLIGAAGAVLAARRARATKR